MIKSKRSGPERALLAATDSAVASGAEGGANAVNRARTAASVFSAARRVVNDELTSSHSYLLPPLAGDQVRRLPTQALAIRQQDKGLRPWFLGGTYEACSILTRLDAVRVPPGSLELRLRSAKGLRPQGNSSDHDCLAELMTRAGFFRTSDFWRDQEKVVRRGGRFRCD